MKLVALTMGLVVSAVSCKQPGESRTKSLDNFAAGKRVRTNVCSGNPALAKDEGLQSLLKEVANRINDADSTGGSKSKNREAVLAAFSALPPFAQTQFLAIGGRIVLSKDANLMCSGTSVQNANSLKRSDEEISFMKEGLSDVQACFVAGTADELKSYGVNASGPIHLIIIKNDAVEISHNFVRVFGYINAQLSARLGVQGDFTSSDSKAVVSGSTNSKFDAVRFEIANAFLADISGRPEAKRFAKFQAMPAGSLGRTVFENFVYAEAFDSYFCNQHDSGEKNTIKVMAREFPKTFAAFSNSLNGKPRSMSSKPSGSFSLSWNPFTWIGDAYGSYVEKRDRIIDGMVSNIMETNGGKPPGFIETVSIAANGAWRPVAEVPVIETVLKPAVKYTDAIAGATIDDNGGAQILTDAQRARLAASATADIALDAAGGMVADAAGKKLGTLGAEKFGEVLLETKVGQKVLTEVVETSPAAGRFVLERGFETVEKGVGWASEQAIDKLVLNPAADVVTGAIAGQQPGSDD